MLIRTSRRAQRLMAFQTLYGQEFQTCSSGDDLKKLFTSVPVLVTGLDASDDEDVRDFRHYVISSSNDDADAGDAEVDAEGFGWDLVYGIWSKRETLDSIIMRFLKNWRLDRLGRAELNILRIGVYEMLYRDDIPPRVSINEALELDKQFGDPRSNSFVNGILDSVCKAIERGEIKG